MKKIVVFIVLCAMASCLSDVLQAQPPGISSEQWQEFEERGRQTYQQRQQREAEESQRKTLLLIGAPVAIIVVFILRFLFQGVKANQDKTIALARKQVIQARELGTLVRTSWNNPSARPFAICTIAGVLLCIFGLVQVFNADPTFAEFGRALGGADDAELYFRRAITNPVLIIGLVALVVGIFGIFANSGNKEE